MVTIDILKIQLQVYLNNFKSTLLAKIKNIVLKKMNLVF